MRRARRWPSGPGGVLLALGAALLVAAVVLGLLDLRAGARETDGAEAVAAARAHLVDLGVVATDPAARARAVDGATGRWRERLTATAPGPPRPTSTAIRSAGLESSTGDTARVVAAGMTVGGTVPRSWRVTVDLERAGGRWLVADVAELP